MRRSVLLLALLTAIVIGVAVPSGSPAAHSGKTSYVYFSIYDDAIEGRVEIPVVDLEAATGVAVPQDPDAARAAVRADLETLQQYVSDHLLVGEGPEGWDLTFSGFSILPAAGTYVQLPFTVDEPFDEVPREFRVMYDGIIEANPDKDAFVLVENDWRAATFNEEANELVSYSAGRTDQTVVLEDASTLESMGGVRGLGTDAFRTAATQVLLVGVLLLPATLTVPGSRPGRFAPRSRSAGVRVGTVLGVLAVSHSLTLWLSGLGAIDLPDRTVRALVELAVLAAAAWVILLAVRPGVVRVERGVVAALGIVQGLGLGLAFDQFDLDRSRPVLSLVAFNVGVEVGIAVLALLVVPTLLLIRRTALAVAALYAGAAVVGAYGLGWLAQRATDGAFMDEVANPLRVWPRNGLLLLVAMGLAGLLYAWTAWRGRLRPLEGTPPATTTVPTEEPAAAVPS